MLRSMGSQIGLMLIDLRMPIIGGAEFARQARALSPAPIVVVSAEAPEQGDSDALSNIAEFVRKPVTPARIAAIVDRYLARPRKSANATSA